MGDFFPNQITERKMKTLAGRKLYRIAEAILNHFDVARLNRGGR